MEISNPRWRQLYQEALLELDYDRLLLLIELTEQAIREYTDNTMPLHPEEVQSIQDALRALSLMRRNEHRG